jgi:putative transcriptional regulator
VANDELQNSLKVYRASLDLTQAELAERAGVTRRSVNAIEAGRMVPSVAVALRISQVLGVPVESLFRYADDPDEAPTPDRAGAGRPNATG